MKKLNLLICVGLLAICGCANKKTETVSNTNSDTTKKEMVCKLTSPELQNRKATVIEAIKKEILEKKELPDGYSYKFNGSDSIYTQLTSFIGSERQCCDFFTFNLKVQGEKDFIWMEITGPDGARQMLTDEAGL